MSEKTIHGLVLLGVVAVLVAIVIPNFVKAKTTGGGGPPNCIAHLKQIDGAIQQWALENKKEDTDAPDLNGAASYLKGGVLPVCPQGCSYRAGATVKDVPICSKATTLGHSLPY
ncbi:MAG: hypothetical protein K0Q55_1978 [Verrucomicrobia bacterium]|jgi:competence protein ComGC|nr:hypothetical protein [Verrucomicrobiota bacterium]